MATLKSNVRNGEITCSYCGDKHSYDSCPHKNNLDNIKCLNCFRNNNNFNTKFNTNHQAISNTNNNCAINALMESRLKEKITYGW